MEASKGQSESARPTGTLISFLTFPVGAFFCSSGLTGLWNVFRELYCRANHETAIMLCHYFSWDFRADAACILFVAFALYVFIHFRWMRILSRRDHVLTLALFGVAWSLIFFASKAVPGIWESW